MLIIDGGSGGAGLELAEDKRTQAEEWRRQEWSWRRTSGWCQDWTDPDSTVELAEDEWTQAVQRSRSIDLELCTHTHMYYPICIWVGGS